MLDLKNSIVYITFHNLYMVSRLGSLVVNQKTKKIFYTAVDIIIQKRTGNDYLPTKIIE